MFDIKSILRTDESVLCGKSRKPETGLYPYSHYILVENSLLKGLFLAGNTPEIPETGPTDDFFHADLGENHFDILRTMMLHESNIIPVTDKNNRYSGYVTLDDMLDIWAESPLISDRGTTLILEISNKDISFSEIAQIVESENAVLNGIFRMSEDNLHTRILLRIESDNINEIVQSFRRYDYRILNDDIEDFLREQFEERSGYLQKYLEM